MTSNYYLISVIVLSVCLVGAGVLVQADGEQTLSTAKPKNAPSPTPTQPSKPDSAQDTTNATTNSTVDATPGSIYPDFLKNKGTLLRAFYVLIAVTMIVLVYFGVRAWRTRRRLNKSRKYGLITTQGSDLEMEPLDRDMDEDDDMTVFEMNGRPK